MFCKPLERSILRFWFSRRFRSRLRFSVMLDGHPILCDPPPSPLGQLMRIPYPFLRCHLTEPVLERVRHVDILPVAPCRGLPVHQPTERRFGVRRIMLGVGSVNRLAPPGRQEYLHGGMAVAAGPAIEGFSNVRVRFDFPARNGLTKFGVAELPGIERLAADAEEVGELLVGQSEQAHPIRALDKLRSISTRTPNAARGAVRLAPAGLFRTGFRLGDVHQRTGNKRGFHCVLHHRDTRSYMAPFQFHVEWKGSNHYTPGSPKTFDQPMRVMLGLRPKRSRAARIARKSSL